MIDYRHAGTFWPANAGGEHPDASTILGLPGSGSLVFIAADSARYWWRQVKGRAQTAVWRGLPRPDRLPADLGWDANRVADECMNLFDEQEHSGVEWFTPLNELQFSKESGEQWHGYADMAVKLARLRIQLRRKFSQKYPAATIKILFPAWVPGDDLAHADEWLDEAMQWDGLRVHAYNNADEVKSRYWAHRNILIDRYGEHGRQFPILVDETNANHTGADERAMVTANAEICRDDPHCLGFCWYIWETNNDGEHDLSIWGNPDRLQLFLSPPTVQPAPIPAPEPIPQPEPEPQPMTRDEIIALIVDKANANGLVPWEFLGGAIAESKLDPQAWRQAIWPDWSAGLYQQTVLYADEGDHTASDENVALIKRLYFDPVHACDVAAVKFKYWRYNPEVPALTAWCAYNLPASYHEPESNPNIENYRAGLAEARRILGIPDEASADRRYVPDVPDEVILQRNNWSCAVRSTYAALWALAQRGKIEAVTYGDEGPRDVYDWMVPEFDDPSVGLHRADGSGLVEMLARHGITAHAEYPTTLSAVQARAGYQPILLGGRAWNHWVLVSGLEPDGTLILENPSPGFGGISGELRDSFDRLGPMTMVWIEEPAPAPVPHEAPELSTLVGVAYHDDGTVIPALVAATTQTDIAQMRQQVDAVVSFLRANNPDRAA